MWDQAGAPKQASTKNVLFLSRCDQILQTGAFKSQRIVLFSFFLFSLLQGAPGQAGMPGPPGPQGAAVSDIRQ